MSKFFFYIQFVYIIFVLFAGIGYFFNSESISISVALSGILAPFIAWFGGSGKRGALNLGDKKQIIIAIILGIICLAVSIFWIQHTGYWITMFDIEMSGNLWVIIGFLIGLIFSTKSHSIGDTFDHPHKTKK